MTTEGADPGTASSPLPERSLTCPVALFGPVDARRGHVFLREKGMT